jgi:hypothetical protein
VLSQERLFAHDVTVEQPHARHELHQEKPMREYQALPQQDTRPSDVNPIATERNDARRTQLIGTVNLNAHPQTLTTCHETEQP